jgi:hypothetical protein
VRGQNVVRNGGFEVKTTGSTAAPDGWTIFGTPTTCTQATAPVSNGTGKTLRIVADAATEGVYQTLSGLKASTLYFIQARYIVNVGSMLVTTTGAIASGEWRDISITKTTATWATVAGVIQTDATPTDIVLSFVSTANLDDFEIDDVCVREMDKEIVTKPNTVIVYDSSTNAGALSAAEAVFPSGDALTAAVTVPGPGCWISVKACARITPGATTETFTCLIRQALTIAGTNSDVDVASIDAFSANPTALALGYTNTSPTPGETYTYSLRQLAVAATGTANGTMSGKTLKSWIEVTLHVPR